MRRLVLALVLASFPLAALAQEEPIEIAPAGDAPIEVTEAPPSRPTSRPIEAPIERVPEPGSYVGLGLLVDHIDLSGHELGFGDPEIAALRGLRLSPDWAGTRTMPRPTTVGASLAMGWRLNPFLRGPEIRAHFAGGDIDGPWARAEGELGEGMELSVRSAAVIRGELAFGLQLPLDPVVPYAMLRGTLGGAWLDVQVREAQLGVLGTETLHVFFAELGFETGIAVRLDRVVEVAFAFRGNFLGPESWGGALTVGFNLDD